MRLTELEPHWVGLAPGHAIGLTFLCPHCRKIRLGVSFDVPIDRQPSVLAGFIGNLEVSGFSKAPWHREGDTFDTLTLTPSVDASAHGHWHGHIVNGEIT